MRTALVQGREQAMPLRRKELALWECGVWYNLERRETSIAPIIVVDAQTRAEMQGELVERLGPAELREIDYWWSLYFELARFECEMRGFPEAHFPDSMGWKWETKYDLDSGEELLFYGIRYGNVFQGAIALSNTPLVCEEPSQAGQEALSVEYLAAAPWNLSAFMRDLQRTPFLRDIGTTLMRVAVLVSRALGYEGRLCLFAVPGACGFYERCGMVDLGDALYHSEELRRFEMTAPGAGEFMGRTI